MAGAIVTGAVYSLLVIVLSFLKPNAGPQIPSKGSAIRRASGA